MMSPTKDLGNDSFNGLWASFEKAFQQKKLEEQVTTRNDVEPEDDAIIWGDGLAKVLDLIDTAASSDAPVLITGETGTEKYLVAKAVHERSATKRKPFLCIHCRRFHEKDLNGAEFFGCEKEAFPGATTERKGFFEMADRGTLFRHEVGEMPLHFQGMLLDFIDDKKVRRLGGEFERSVSVRIMASSNADMEKAVGSALRKDLYYRLNVIRMHIPPLRERRRDIPALCHGLLTKITGREDAGLPAAELKKLMEYDWPGNVRELKNVMQKAVVLQNGSELQPSEFLTKTVTRELIPCREDRIITLEEIEKQYIELALQRFSCNITKAAEVLGISRSTLKRKIKEMEQRRA